MTSIWFPNNKYPPNTKNYLPCFVLGGGFSIRRKGLVTFLCALCTTCAPCVPVWGSRGPCLACSLLWWEAVSGWWPAEALLHFDRKVSRGSSFDKGSAMKCIISYNFCIKLLSYCPLTKALWPCQAQLPLGPRKSVPSRVVLLSGLVNLEELDGGLKDWPVFIVFILISHDLQ